MNRYEYVALTNPRGASKMVSMYNLTPDRNPRVLAKQMAYCVSRDPEQAKFIFAKIHPDRDVFEQEINTIKAALDNDRNKLTEMFSNMNGQAMKREVEQLKNFDGDSTASSNKRSELLIIGGIILISLALVLKK
jgi:hypothetical protein